jgi:hypothetical protein
VMYHYDQSGSLLTTYTMTGMPATNAGGGYSVFGNKIYVCNSSGFYKGIISIGSISFSLVPSTPTLVLGASDFGNCATMSTGFLNYAFTNSGPIGCTSSSSTLTAGGWPASTTYSWSGPSISGAVNNQTALATSPGVYSCTITAPGNCPTIMSTSVPANSVTLTTNTLSNPICQGSTATLTVSGANSYTWAPASSLSSSSATLVIASPTVNTTYTVSGSTGTCVSNVALTVSVAVCSGVQEQESFSELNFYPNPNNGELIITSKTTLSLILSNELGQEIRSVILKPEENYQARIGSLPEGIYFISDRSSGKVYKNKIVVIRK